MNIGYFTSFTAFLALNDANFCNNYLRAVPYKEGILPLAGYLQFWGCFFVVVTVLIAFFKHETNFQPAGVTSTPPVPPAILVLRIYLGQQTLEKRPANALPWYLCEQGSFWCDLAHRRNSYKDVRSCRLAGPHQVHCSLLGFLELLCCKSHNSVYAPDHHPICFCFKPKKCFV